MASDPIKVDFPQLSQVAREFQAEAQKVRTLTNNVSRQMEVLKRGGWKAEAATTFYRQMETEMLTGLTRLDKALDTSHDVVLELARVYNSGDEAAAACLQGNETALGRLAHAIRENLNGWVAGGGSQFPSVNYKFDDFPHTLFPSQTDILHDYLGKKLSYEEADILMKVASKDSTWLNHIDAKGNFFEQTLASGEFNPWTQEFGNEQLKAKLSGPSYEYNAKVKGEIDLKNLEISGKLEGSIGGYLGRAQGSAELNGFKAVGDAYVGARANGEVGVEFDPRHGDVKFIAKGEAFAGAEAQGSVGYENEFFKVNLQGSVAAGAGVKGRFDVGMNDGVLTADIGVLGALGVGGGGGLKVEVDIPKVTGKIVEEGAEVVENFVEDGYKFLDRLF